jgi:hypothetical protein
MKQQRIIGNAKQQQESNNLLSELVQIHKGEREEKAREKEAEAKKSSKKQEIC